MNNEFKLSLQAIIDETNSKANINKNISNLQNQVDKLRIKAELDSNILKNLTAQLQSAANQKITLSNIGVKTSQVKQTGQQMGTLISSEAEKAISSVSSAGLNKAFRIDKTTSSDFKKEMSNLVNGWTNAKGQLTDIKIDTKTVYDKKAQANIENLKQATVTYKNELDEVIKKTIAWRQTGTNTNIKGEEEALYGFVEVAGSYSKALERVSTASDTFSDKQLKLKASLSDTLTSLKSGVSDPNVSKPIKSQDSITGLEQQYKMVETAISNVGTSNKSNFAEMEVDARTQISLLQDMIHQYKNAESVATSLRTKDFDTVKSIEIQGLNEFENKIKTSKVPISELENELSLLRTSLGNSFDTQGLTSFLNEMDIAKAKFKSLKAEFSNKNNFEIAQIKADGLSSIINSLSSANVGLDQFEATINNTKVTVSSLLSELSRVKTTGDVSVVTTKWDAFTNSAKEAGKISNENIINEKQLIQFDAKRVSILQTISTYLSQHSKFTKENTAEAKQLQAEFEQIKNDISALGRGDNIGLGTLNKELSTAKSKVKELGLEGRSATEEIKNMFQKFSGWFSVSQGIMFALGKFKEAIVELKQIDTTLTEISKTANVTAEQLTKIGDNSFETASQFGVKANDYLIGIQEMSRAGYENSEKMAELATMAKSAGDMSAELANDYLIASDAAYGYGGNVEKLTALLDGQNQITNRHAVSMEELANATKVAGTMLANVANIPENELSALLGTGIATSKESGETVARAVKGIMMNLQQVKGESGFDGEIIDEESLKKVEARCHSVGVELEFMKDGIARLRDPMDILKELADVYNSLPKDSADRAGIIADIGGKYRGNTLASLLKHYNKVEKMMGDYENSSGSAMNEAMKSANNFEGSLNRLSNTWTDTIQNVVGSKELTTAVNSLNGLLDVVNKITSALGGLGTAGLIGGGILGAKSNSLDYRKIRYNANLARFR